MAPARKSKADSRPGPTVRKRSKASAPVGMDDVAVTTTPLAPLPSRLVVNWNEPRTNRLLDWLDQNPVDRHRLFSDSIAHAKAEGRKKVKAKGDKAVFHKKIAEAVFNVPEETAALRERYKRQPDKFMSSVVNYLSRLRTGYRDFNTELGRTGAGLDYSEVTPGSNLHNLIDKLKQDFPYWERLHGYWRTLPNYNPLTVNSEPGQDLEAQAIALLDADDTGGSQDDIALDGADSRHSNALTQEELEELEADPDADAEGQEDEEIPSPSEPALPGAGVTQDLSNGFSSPSFGSSRNGNNATSKPPPTRTSRKPSSTPKTSSSSLGKRSALVAFGIENENDAAISASLRSKKYDRDLATLALKKAKLDFLAQREAAERERKREAHELQMMQLRLQMQVRTPQARSSRPFNDLPAIASSSNLSMPTYNVDSASVFGGDLVSGSLQAMLNSDLDFGVGFDSQ